MAWDTLKAAIEDAIKTNGNQEITGQILQTSLISMVNSLGENYQFAGIATTTTNPGSPDGNVFYITYSAGTYVNFNGIVVNKDELCIILNTDEGWVKTTVGSISQVGKAYIAQSGEPKGEIFNDYVNNRAEGVNSHSEGSYNRANGDNSHAGGERTVANSLCETAIGRYNDSPDENADPNSWSNTDALLLSVGCGSAEYDRKNAVEIQRSGATKILKHSSDFYYSTPSKLEKIDVQKELLYGQPLKFTWGCVDREIIIYTNRPIPENYQLVILWKSKAHIRNTSSSSLTRYGRKERKNRFAAPQQNANGDVLAIALQKVNRLPTRQRSMEFEYRTNKTAYELLSERGFIVTTGDNSYAINYAAGVGQNGFSVFSDTVTQKEFIFKYALAFIDEKRKIVTDIVPVYLHAKNYVAIGTPGDLQATIEKINGRYDSCIFFGDKRE